LYSIVLYTTRAPYIPMPEGRGFTAIFDKNFARK
jgi:hypothetical protein